MEFPAFEPWFMPVGKIGGKGSRLARMGLVGGHYINFSHIFHAVNEMVNPFGVDAVVVGNEYKRFHIF